MTTAFQGDNWIPVILRSDDPTNVNKGQPYANTKFNNILQMPVGYDISEDQIVQVALLSWSYELHAAPAHATQQYTLYTDLQTNDVREGNSTTGLLTPYQTLETGEQTFNPNNLLWQNTNIDAGGVQNISVIISDKNGDIPGDTVPANDFVAPNFVTLAFRVARQIN